MDPKLSALGMSQSQQDEIRRLPNLGGTSNSAKKFKTKGVFWNGSEYRFSAQIMLRSLSTGNTWSFPAFVESFSDSYNSSWNAEDVFGRIDPIYTFKNNKRIVELQFVIPAWNTLDAFNNWITINEILQSLYPQYKDVSGEKIISSPPIFGLKFHNLIREVNTGQSLQDFVYGVFEGGLQMKPNLDEGYLFDWNVYREFWDDQNKATQLRKLSENYGGARGDGGGLLILPKSYTMSFSFSVLHSMFRGNLHGKLNSRGGPAVSATEAEAREFQEAGEMTRTEGDVVASQVRRDYLSIANEAKIASITGGPK
jgi:hypothetical protein